MTSIYKLERRSSHQKLSLLAPRPWTLSLCAIYTLVVYTICICYISCCYGKVTRRTPSKERFILAYGIGDIVHHGGQCTAVGEGTCWSCCIYSQEAGIGEEL